MGNASKCFLCFRPPSTLEIEDGVDCSADRVLSLIASARSNNRLKGKKTKKMLKPPDSSVPDPNLPQTTSRRSFASVVRAVVFQTSISRSIREAKLRNRSGRSATKLPSDEDSTAATADPKTAGQIGQIVVDFKCNSNKAPGSDCCFTPTAVERAEQKEIGGKTGGNGIINPVALVVLLSLLATVFCGRLCAVMTTTVWIYAWRTGAFAAWFRRHFQVDDESKTTFSLQKESNRSSVV